MCNRKIRMVSGIVLISYSKVISDKNSYHWTKFC